MNDVQLRAMYEQINKYTGTSRLNPHFNAGYKAGFKAACEWRDSQNQQMNQPLVHALEQILEWAGPPTGSEFGTLNRISLMAGAALATIKKEQTK